MGDGVLVVECGIQRVGRGVGSTVWAMGREW